MLFATSFMGGFSGQFLAESIVAGQFQPPGSLLVAVTEPDEGLTGPRYTTVIISQCENAHD